MNKIENEQLIKNIMLQVCDALSENGYNPIIQITRYILSDDPTYITSKNNARNLICKIDRDQILRILVKEYLMDENECR